FLNSDRHHYAIAQEWGNGDSRSAISEQSRNLVQQAREQYDRTTALLAEFQEMSEGLPDPDGHYARVNRAFSTLLTGGVEPLFMLLEQGNIDRYQSFVGRTSLH